MKYLDFTDLLDSEPASLAILSTYQFDPDYFERRLLRCSALVKARRILIFLDARQWYRLLRHDAPARFLNRRYLVVPVQCSQGVFHPKLNLLLTEHGGQILCGSNNLTRAGCSSNLELLNAFTFHHDDESSEPFRLAQEAFRFFQRACKDGEVEPARIGRAWLEEAAQFFSWLKQPLPTNGNRRIKMLHTYDGSLWDRFVAVVDAAHPSRFLIISPFFDLDGELVKRLRKRWPACHVEIIVQQQITTFPVNALKGSQDWLNLHELRNAKRRLHAKLIAWQGSGGTGCLVGSANFTTAAFDARNVETCLQVADAGDSVQSLFDKELPKRAIGFEEFEPGSEQEPSAEDGPTSGLKLTSALLLSNDQLRVNYVAQTSSRPSSLRVGICVPGESFPRAIAPLPIVERASATVNIPPAALADAHGTVLAFLIAESQGHREESDPIWVIQENRLTYEPTGERSSLAMQKVEETGEGLTELLEEIGKRDGPTAVIEYLSRLDIRFSPGGSGPVVGTKCRLRIHDPFDPDLAPQWLINFKSDTTNLSDAIREFVDRHIKGPLVKHARYGNVNGIENFLDIFAAIVRLLYVYYSRKVVNRGGLIGPLLRCIGVATGGLGKENPNCCGYLRAVANTLQDEELLQQASDAVNFAGHVRAALMIVQRVGFVPNKEPDPYSPPPKGPRECFPADAKLVRDTFATIGLAEPKDEAILEGLGQYWKFSDTDMNDFQAELKRIPRSKD